MAEFTHLLRKLGEGAPLSPDEAKSFFYACLTGEATTVQIAAGLMAMKVRGETLIELKAGTEVLREQALIFETDYEVIDTCGTGGDGAHTLNISTAVSLVVAGTGQKVAKHGNRSVSSRSGSSDVLLALGVDINCGLEKMHKALDEANICFLFAPNHHKAMRFVAEARKELGVRTIFNLLGPMSNPAMAKRQVLGVYDKRWLRPLSEVLRALGSKKTWVIHGCDGLDELTLTGPSLVCEWDGNQIHQFELDPRDYGFSLCHLDDVRGGDADDNAKALLRLFEGETGPYYDIVALNAAAALVVSDKVSTLEDGVILARQSLDQGWALNSLKILKQTTN